jgi:hypothetical protein
MNGILCPLRSGCPLFSISKSSKLKKDTVDDDMEMMIFMPSFLRTRSYGSLTAAAQLPQ